jgi:hypothetical protein
MMPRYTRILIVALILTAVLFSGCSAQQTGTFSSYEVRKSVNPGYIGKNPYYTDYQPTGNAVLILEDGTYLTAKCPVAGLRKGNKVGIKKGDDGGWVVTKKQ